MNTVRLSRHIAELACTDRPVFLVAISISESDTAQPGLRSLGLLMVSSDQVSAQDCERIWTDKCSLNTRSDSWKTLMVALIGFWMKANTKTTRATVQYKKNLTAYMCCCCKDKTVVRTSHIYNGNAPHGFILKCSPGPLLLNGFTQYG